MYCCKCGKQIPEESKFCLYCGEALPEAEEKPAPKKEEPPARQVVKPTIRQAEKAEAPKKEKKDPFFLRVPVWVWDALIIALVIAGLAAATGLKSRTDKRFLRDMEDTVVSRYFDTAQDADLAALLDGELEALEDYSHKSFHDKQLKSLAQDYIDALQAQRELLIYDPAQGETYYSDALAWYEAGLRRNRAVLSLHEDYGLLDVYPEIVRDYAASVAWQEALVAVETDLRAQLTGVMAEEPEEDAPRTVGYTNNTPYGLDLVFLNAYILADRSYTYDEQSARLEPGEQVAILLTGMPEDYVQWTLFWDIEDIRQDGLSLLP